jgi:hypothetical protein
MCTARNGLLLAALTLVQTTALAQVVLEPPQPVTTTDASFTSSLAGGDLNEDGLLDVVYATGFFQDLIVLTSAGDGSFVETSVPAVAVGVQQVAVADIDGDSHLDVVAGATVLLGAGDGTFPGTQALPAGGAHVVVGAITGDAAPDIVTVTPIPFSSNADYHVLHNLGDGSFVQVQILAGTLPRALDLGDFDEDGSTDLLVVLANRVDIHFGLPGGTFETGKLSLPVEAAQQQLVADLDGDGHLDLAFTTGSPMNGVTLLAGHGDGTFTAPVLHAFGQGPKGLAAADYDLDGALDLAVFSTATNEIGILRGDGAGGFALDIVLSGVALTGLTEPLDPRPQAGLVDGDAHPDLVFQALLDGELSVQTVRNHTYAVGAPFADLGGELKGSAGYPVLLADGTLQAGTPYALDLHQVQPGLSAWLFLGFAPLGAPFKGGILHPQPDVLFGPFVADAEGRVPFGGAWPTLHGGYDIVLQFWIVDPGGPVGLAASAGLVLAVPAAGG